MSAPRTKRPFAGAAADPAQRQITSFFSASAASAADPPSFAARYPVLPASVQANLLSVGMRVRKSVPEGYRTTSPSAFKLWTDTTPPAAALDAPATKAAAAGTVPRELLPFCGINKVGGLGTQSETSGFYDDDNDLRVPDLDAVPGLTLSQESAESNATESSRKRIFDDEEDDDAPAIEGLHSKRAWDANSGNARLMATPRRSRAAKGFPLEAMGQENLAVDDFEEAPFLVFGQGRDMDLSQ